MRKIVDDGGGVYVCSDKVDCFGDVDVFIIFSGIDIDGVSGTGIINGVLDMSVVSGSVAPDVVCYWIDVLCVLFCGNLAGE